MKNKLQTAALLILLTSQPLLSQRGELASENSLFYTFIGPVVSAGYGGVKERYWDGAANLYSERKNSGPLFGGGCSFSLIADSFAGNFRAEYLYNTGGDGPVTHSQLSMNVSYIHAFNKTLSLGIGAGLYLETPPSTGDYASTAGFLLPATVYITTGFDTLLFTEICGKYGYFNGSEETPATSIADNPYRYSASISLGFLLKIGRI